MSGPRIGKCEACGILCGLTRYEGKNLCHWCRTARRHPEEVKYMRPSVKKRVRRGLEEEEDR